MVRSFEVERVRSVWDFFVGNRIRDDGIEQSGEILIRICLSISYRKKDRS